MAALEALASGVPVDRGEEPRNRGISGAWGERLPPSAGGCRRVPGSHPHSGRGCQASAGDGRARPQGAANIWEKGSGAKDPKDL